MPSVDVNLDWDGAFTKELTRRPTTCSCRVNIAHYLKGKPVTYVVAKELLEYKNQKREGSQLIISYVVRHTKAKFCELMNQSTSSNKFTTKASLWLVVTIEMSASGSSVSPTPHRYKQRLVGRPSSKHRTKSSTQQPPTPANNATPKSSYVPLVSIPVTFSPSCFHRLFTTFSLRLSRLIPVRAYTVDAIHCLDAEKSKNLENFANFYELRVSSYNNNGEYSVSLLCGDYPIPPGIYVVIIKNSSGGTIAQGMLSHVNCNLLHGEYCHQTFT